MHITSPSFPVLFTSSVLCLLLAGCGVDDKPTIPSDNDRGDNGGTPTVPVDNRPQASIANMSTNLSEDGGELYYIITVNNLAALKEGETYTLDYTLSGDGIDDLLQDPSKKSGTVTLKQDMPQVELKLTLKSDGKPTDSIPVTLTLSNPSSNLALSDNPSSTSRINNTDAGLSIANSSKIKGEEDATIRFSISTHPKQPVDADTKVFFEVVAGTAKAGIDYRQPSSRFVTIKAGEDSASLDIELIGSPPAAPLEFYVDLLSDSQLALFPNKTRATGSISSYVAASARRTAVNDTGVVTARGDSSNLNDCTATTAAQQDCNTGRDTTHHDDSDGVAGFSFTKLDSSGNELAANATTWSCVRDNVTGLIWESKTYHDSTDDKDWRDSKWEYGFYDSKTQYGIKDNGADERQDDCGNASKICSTEHYAVSVNAVSLCGMTDWRLPTRFELLNVMNLSSKSSAVVMQQGWLYPEGAALPFSLWTSSPAAYKGYNSPSYRFDNIWTAYTTGSWSKEDPSSRYSSAGVVLVSNGSE